MAAYNFTDRVRKVLQLAREESQRLHHEYVDAEHILLGILREGEGVAAAVLARMDVDLMRLRAAVEGALKPGRADDTSGPDLPYTSYAKRALEGAMTEARELGYTYVGTEHLLLGLLRGTSSRAAAALVAAGVTLERARAVSLELRGPERGGPSALPDLVPVGALALKDPVARRALAIAIVALLVAIVALIVSLR